MKYRPEVDGLRALAVLPVIFFHAGWQFFRGGFVGVDVFFVISGYLISSIIISEKREGTFSVARFYERRARRILPALIVVVLACLPFAWAWLLPTDLKDFTKSVRAVFTFSSNILFKHQSGYFETAAELKPLLHTWSLAVEEQFYIVFPMLLWAVWRAGKVGQIVALSIVSLISLCWSEWSVRHEAAGAYFLLPSRAWELLAGSVLALWMQDWRHGLSTLLPGRVSSMVGEAGALVGLSMIVCSILLIDQHAPFPGLFALWPTMGAVLVIGFASPRNMVGALLGRELPVRLGLISYSAYLWHQPMFAFARHRFVDGPSPWLMAALAFASLCLAYLTWRYVETPARNKVAFPTKRLVTVCAASFVALIGVGVVGERFNGFESRLSEDQRKLFAYTRYDVVPVYRQGECFLEPDQSYKAFSKSCRGVANQARPVMIWGDSHAAALSAGLRALAPGLAQYAASGCPPFVDYASSWRSMCHGVNVFVQEEIKRIQPSVLYLHANWPLYKDEGISRRLERTIQFLRQASPATYVVVIGGVPQYPPSLPVVMLRHGMDIHSARRLVTPMYQELAAIDRDLALFAQREQVRFVSSIERLCDARDCMVASFVNGLFVPLAWDYGHLTMEGATLLANHVLQRSAVH